MVDVYLPRLLCYIEFGTFSLYLGWEVKRELGEERGLVRPDPDNPEVHIYAESGSHSQAEGLSDRIRSHRGGVAGVDGSFFLRDR